MSARESTMHRARDAGVAAGAALGLYIVALTLWSFAWFGRAAAIVLGCAAYIAVEFAIASLLLPTEEAAPVPKRYSLAEILQGVPRRDRTRLLIHGTLRLLLALLIFGVLLWIASSIVPRLPWLS